MKNTCSNSNSSCKAIFLLLYGDVISREKHSNYLKSLEDFFKKFILVSNHCAFGLQTSVRPAKDSRILPGTCVFANSATGFCPTSKMPFSTRENWGEWSSAEKDSNLFSHFKKVIYSPLLKPLGL